MKKRASRKNSHAKNSSGKKKDRTIGRQRFAKISAVEGIVLSKAMTARARAFDRRGASAEERRAAIISAYRKS